MSPGSQTYDLESNAPKLRVCKDKDGKPTEQVWGISFPDGRRDQVYLDASTCHAVSNIQAWAANRCRWAFLEDLDNALPTLVVSGLVKTGKSYTLNKVVPAVLAEALAKEPPEHPLKGMRVLRLNCMILERRSGAGALMYDLLRVVVDWAVEADVRVNDREWSRAQAALADGPKGVAMHTRAGRAVVELFESGFQTPVLVLADELQALLQPTASDGGLPEQLDRGHVAFIRDCVLRRILINTPPHVLWAVTGSGMALVWMSLAAMPVNGTAPLNQIKTVHLPASVPSHLMQELLVYRLRYLGLSQPQELEAVRQELETLLELSGNSPALFSMMSEQWAIGDLDITSADNFWKNKLFSEAKEEWHLAMAHMSREDRCRMLDLANVVLGAELSEFKDEIFDSQRQGLWCFLEPYMLKTEHGRYYLADPMQRLLLRAVLGEGGNLRTSFTGLGTGLTLAQLDWGWLLLQLGEVADYLVGVRRPPKDFPSHVKGAAELTAMLKALESPYSKGSRAWYELKGKDLLKNDLDYLVFFLRLCRVVLAHHWRQQGLVEITQVTVMALPEMLGVSAHALGEQVRACMAKLEPATIKAAAAAADAEEAKEERASATSPGTPSAGIDSSADTGSAPSSPDAPNTTGASAPSGASASRNVKHGAATAVLHVSAGAGATGCAGRVRAPTGAATAGWGADPASGAGTPAATGGGRPGISCSKAHTALSSSGSPAAARRCLLAGKAVVPRTRAMLPAPVVRRLNLMRVTATAQASFRFS